MTETKPSLGQLWNQAGGDVEKYRELMREHGLLVPCQCPCHQPAPGSGPAAPVRGHCDRCRPKLPCGWEPGKTRAEQERCKHDLLAASCADCTGRTGEPDPSRERPAYGPWIAAAYPGRCSGCDDRIEVGDSIRADGKGGWLCDPCGDSGVFPL